MHESPVMNSKSNPRQPLVALIGIALSLALVAATVVATPDAGAQVADSAQVVVSAESRAAADEAASRLGATVVGPMEIGEGLYLVESPQAPSAHELAATMAADPSINWAEPAEATVHANPFYAWGEVEGEPEAGPAGIVQANPFYAWNQNQGGNERAATVQANPFYAWNQLAGGAEPTVQANPFYAWADPAAVVEVVANPFYAWNGGALVNDDRGYDLRQYLGLDALTGLATGDGVTVAIIDTGFSSTHPMIGARLLPGMDFVDGDNDPTDEQNLLDDDGDGLVDEAFGHGTHVAGVVAQIAPGADILPIRALDADGVGTIYAVVAAVEYAIEQDVDVLNFSFGTDDPSPSLQAVLSAAEQQGVIVVAAAGNSDRNVAQIPASYPSVISVAAFDPADRTVASFGNYGRDVNVSAVGVAVRSAYRDEGITTMSGSSVASPVVAAQAALLLEAHPRWDDQQIANHIRSSAAAEPVNKRPTRHGEVKVTPSVLSASVLGVVADPLALVLPEPTDPVVEVDPARSLLARTLAPAPIVIATPAPTPAPAPIVIPTPTPVDPAPRSSCTALFGCGNAGGGLFSAFRALFGR